MTSTSSESLMESAWQLPSKYREMGPSDQVSAMRNGILTFLEHAGRATLSEIVTAIGAPYDRTVRRQVQYLASTQQLYVDPVGRDPLYFRNGKLAHPVLQANVHAGLTDYAIRTYGDNLTGRYVTITEYALTSLGEAKAKGGIRVDVADLQTFLDQLARIRKAIVEDPSLLDGGLVRRGREGRER
jgi:hypothetical protein